MTFDINPVTQVIFQLNSNKWSLALPQATLIWLWTSSDECLIISNQALRVSLYMRALGVPRIPYAVGKAKVLHLPAGFIPEQAKASFSNSTILESEMAAA